MIYLIIFIILFLVIEVRLRPRLDKTNGKLILWYGKAERKYIILYEEH